MPKRNFSGALTIPPGTTGAITGPDIVNFEGASGVAVIVNVVSNPGGLGATTITIEGRDKLSGVYWTILQSASLSAVAVTRLRVHPELAAQTNLVARDVLPELWRIRTSGNGSPMTYSVGWSTLAGYGS